MEALRPSPPRLHQAPRLDHNLTSTNERLDPSVHMKKEIGASNHQFGASLARDIDYSTPSPPDSRTFLPFPKDTCNMPGGLGLAGTGAQSGYFLPQLHA